MKKLIFTSLAVSMLALVSGCASDSAVTSPDKIKYPYYASPTRSAQIVNGSRKLVMGMPQSAVVKAMGEPDEKNYLYKNMANMEARKADGYIWVYLVQRVRPYGGMLERKEKSVRLEFDLNRNLKKIDSQGMRGIRSQKARKRIPGAVY